MKKFHIASILLGIVLLIFLIAKVGPGSLWRDLRLLGWGLIPFILMEGVVDVFYTVGWRYCLSSPHRTISFSRLFAIRLAGTSINYFTPTATLGGEVIKGILLSSHEKGPEAATAVIIGKLSFALSQLLFVVLGSLFILWRLDLPAAGSVAMLMGSTVVGSGIAAFLVIQKHGKLGAVMRWLVAHKVGGQSLRRAAHQITQVDEALKVFYRDHPGNLLLSMLWHAVGMSCSIIKTWYFMVLMADGFFSSAAGIWFLSTWFDLLTFPIPLGIGVMEGIRVLAFRALGFHLTLGLAYGIAVRLDQLFWATVGLFVYAALIRRKGGKGLISPKGVAGNHPSFD